jgi:hypothetical protein
MAMTARLLGINAIAVELDKDRRTISRALRQVPPDGKADNGNKAWFLTTALRALEMTEGRHRAAGGGLGDDAVIIELDYAGRRMCEMIDRLRDEPDVRRRREMVEGGQGRVVGEFFNAVERARAFETPECRMVEQPFINIMMGRAIGEVLSLCRWEFEPDK